MNSEAPKSLSKPARAWWSALMREFTLDDAGSRLLLETAMRAWDRAEAASAAIEKDGAVLRDASGRPVKHPLLSVERDCRGQVLQAFRLLNLDPGTTLKPKIGRPPGGRGGGL